MIINTESNKEITLDQLNISTRLYNIARRNGINNLYDLLESYASGAFSGFRNAGSKCLEEIANLTYDAVKPLSYDSDLVDEPEEKTDNVTLARKAINELDFEVIELLKSEYGFKLAALGKWYGITRQGVDIRYKNAKRKQMKYGYSWRGFEYSEDEDRIFFYMLENRIREYSDYNYTYVFFNNLSDNVCFIIVSPSETRCFFRDDLSESLQIYIQENRFAELDFDEFVLIQQAKYVNRLKVTYYIPNDKVLFSNWVKKRQITPDEYSQFLVGKPLGSEKGICDEDIIAFLEQNINEEGKVHIKADAKNQWIKSYASRNGFGINEFIEFYGYESALSNDLLTPEGARARHLEAIKKYIVSENIVYIPCTCDLYRILNGYSARRKQTMSEYVEELGFKRVSSLDILDDEDYFDEVGYDDSERDMQIYDCGEDFVDRIFALNPILGNYNFSEKNLQILNNQAKKIVDNVVSGKTISDREKKILALSIVNYAKNWDTDKGTFTNYIIKQYGYRSEDRVYYPIIGEAFAALRDNNKWTITQYGKNQYKSTFMAHAMGSVRSWMTLCDFLSDFYQNNLGCNFDEEDPYILKMVLYLKGIFYKADIEENENYVEFTIGAKPYSFQEGIRKLIVFRPNYAAKVFSRMIMRMDDSISSTPVKATNYEDELVDMWFRKKKDFYSRFNAKNNVANHKHRIAYTYASINPEYQIRDNRLYLEIPDIRIAETTGYNYYLEVLEPNGKIFERRKMSYYGNELGITLLGETYDFTTYLLHEESGLFEPVIAIKQGENVIYNSDNKLHRKTLCFCNGKEIAWSSIKTGKYTFLARKEASFTGENVYVLSENTVGHYRYTDIVLEDNYTLVIDDTIISFDKKHAQSIRMEFDEYNGHIKYIENGQEYDVCKRKTGISLLIDKDDSEQKYILYLNNNRVTLSELQVNESETMIEYLIPVDMVVNKNRVQLIDLSTNRLLLDKWFTCIQNFSYSFDRPYYYSREEIKDCVVEYKLGETEADVINYEGSNQIEIPYSRGSISVELPMISILDSTGNAWRKNEYYLRDIKEEEIITVHKNCNVDCSVIIGDNKYSLDDNQKINIGEVLRSITDKREVKFVLEVYANGAVQSYRLGKIKYEETFVSTPKIELLNDQLLWDCGYGFIGERSVPTYISINDDMGVSQYNSTIELSNAVLAEQLHLLDGEYFYEIYRIRRGDLQERQVLAKGSFVSGDADRLRFKGYRIEINQIVFDNYVQTGVKNILTAYVDQIEYDEELSRQECSEGICPRYTGVMYFINPDGKRHDYAFEREERSTTDIRLKTNPVKLTYVNDGIMLLNDCDGDSILYLYYTEKTYQRRIYHITDHAMNSWESDRYDTVDLVRYTKVKLQK